MALKCGRCGGKNLLQEASLMLNPNEEIPEAQKVLDDLEWVDYFYCEDCDDGTDAEETD